MNNPAREPQPSALPKSSVRLWLAAMRPFSFTASIIPVLVGAAAGLYFDGQVRWALLPAVLLAAVSLHAGTNLLNDTHDFTHGVDREGTLGGSGLLVGGVITPRATARAAWLCFAVAALIGIGLCVLRGWPMAVIGGVGLIGGYAYTGPPLGYKYRALGDPLVFLLMGPLMVVGSDLALSGSLHRATVWVGIPIGLLVMSILHGNNLRDRNDDAESGFTTVAMLLGGRRARIWYAAMVLLAFGAVALLFLVGLLPWWSALVALALPAAVRNVRRVLRSGSDGADRLVDIDVQSAQTHAIFGACLCLSLVLGSMGWL